MEDLMIRLTYYVLQTKTVSYTHARDRFIECSDARIAVIRFPRGKARSNCGAVMHKRMGNVNFRIFSDFIHVNYLIKLHRLHLSVNEKPRDIT